VNRAIAFWICIAFATSASGAELGRLFFTPTEREQLDLARMQKKATPPPASTQSTSDGPAPEIVTYGGIVRRSDGKAMLWINNRVAEEKEALGALSLKGNVRPDGAVALHVPQSGATIEMKVGQSLDLQSGQVAEGRKAPASPKAPLNDHKPEAAEPKTATAPNAAKPLPNEAAEKRPDPERRPEPSTPLAKERLSSKDAAQK
jgi:hypothetical protein